MDLQILTQKENLLKVNDKLNDKFLMDYDYPMYYDHGLQYIQPQMFVLSNEKYEELRYITEVFVQILSKISKMLRYQMPQLQELFVTKDEYYLYIISRILKFDDFLTIIGRFDWGIDDNGNFKLFEFNSDTPAGLCESTFVTKLIHEEFQIDNYKNPNTDLLNLIVEAMDKYIIGNLGERDKYTMVFACGKIASEDYFNVKVIYDYFCKHSSLKDKLFLDFVDMSEIKISFEDQEPNYMYTNKIKEKVDILYRFYPLEWMLQDNNYPNMRELLYLIAEGKILSINPPHTMTVHSKGILSLLYQIVEQSKVQQQNLFTAEELTVLNKHMVPSYLDFDESVMKGTYVAKPFFSREGANISFVDKDFYNPSFEEKDYIYQEKFPLKKVEFFSHDNGEITNVKGYVVLSTYAIGNKFGGILTRVGGEITDKDAYFIPTLIKTKEAHS